MTDFKRWLIMAPVAAGFIAATVCAASAQQDRQPGFLDNLFGGSERLAPSAEPAQGQYQGQGQGQGQGRQERSNELMVRLERLEADPAAAHGSRWRNCSTVIAPARSRRFGTCAAAYHGCRHRSAALRLRLVRRCRHPCAPAPAATAPEMAAEDIFDPAQNPTAPGAPHVLGSPASASAPLPQASEPSEEAAAGPDGAPLDLSTLSEAAARDPSLATPGRMASGGQGASGPARGPRGGEQLATLPPSDSPKDNFDLAYGYVMRKDYALAQDGFRSFLTRFPNDRLARDAYYWLGEACSRVAISRRRGILPHRVDQIRNDRAALPRRCCALANRLRPWARRKPPARRSAKCCENIRAPRSE